MRIYHDFYSHEDFNKELYSLLVYYLAHNITFIGLDRDDIYAAFPYERKYKLHTSLKNEERFHALGIKTLNITIVSIT